MVTWILENWEGIAAVGAAVVAILKWLGKRKYAAIIDAIMQAVEDRKDPTVKTMIRKETVKAGPAVAGKLEQLVDAKFPDPTPAQGAIR